MNERVKSLLIYAAKCTTGTLVVFSIANLIHYTDIGWCLISVMLVLSADGKDSVTLAITRIKANILGGGIGLLCLLISPSNMFTISLGLSATLSLCYLFKLDTGIRSALAATIIIMLHQEGNHLWNSAAERIIAVLAGCSIALAITFIFHARFSKGTNPGNDHHQEA